WTTDGVGHARMVDGNGSITGSLVADDIVARRGVLHVSGTLTATVAAGQHAQGVENALLDRTGTTPQKIGSFEVRGPDAPAAIPTVAATDTRVVAPGIARTL